LTPAVVAGGGADLATFLTASMNSALAIRLAGEAGVTTFDLFGLSTQIAANPALFGFTDVSNACGAVVGANCNQYAYWDGIHPTAATHRIFADAILALAVPEPETWMLFAGGLALLGVISRRRARPGRAA
jgi:phospholipase/lecithinase/hemolysin